MKTRFLILPLITLTLLIPVNVVESFDSNYEIIPWDDFEYEFIGKGAIFKNDLPGLAILEAGTQYFVIVKAEFTESSFGDKPTAVDATVGYAIMKGDHIPRPPMHENATEEEHMEFSMKHQKLIEEFPKQSAIEDSYDFVVDVKNPFYIKFPLQLKNQDNTQDNSTEQPIFLKDLVGLLWVVWLL